MKFTGDYIDERITATVSPATLKTKEDGTIFQKNSQRLRLYLDRYLLQSAGYGEDARLDLMGVVKNSELLAIRFRIGSVGRTLSTIKVRSGKAEVPIPGSVLPWPLPVLRKRKCWFKIDTDSDTLTVAIPLSPI